MTKPFNEVFPNLRVKGNLQNLYSDVEVSRVAFNQDHTKLFVYIESNHLIHKKFIYEMERQLTAHVCAGTPVLVVLIEHYHLSAQYNPQILMEEYGESIAAEMWHASPVLGSFFKSAEMDYTVPGEITMKMEDSCLARDESGKMVAGLSKIFADRCGIPCVFHTDFSLPVRHRAKADMDHVSVNEGAIAAKRQDAAPLLSDADRAAMDAALLAGMQNTDALESAANSVEQKAAPAPAPAAKTGGSSRGSWDGGGRSKGRKGSRFDNNQNRGVVRSNHPDVIFGRDFDDSTIPISDIVGEIGEVAIRGKVTSNERRDIRNEKSILKFTMTDFTDSIICKIFAPTEFVDDLLNKLSPGKFVKVKGYTKEDTFEHEITITSPSGIMSIPSFVTKRQDHYSKKRVELHMHTKMSDMDGISECHDLVQRAYEWGMPAIAITDHGNIQAFPDANHFVADTLDAVNKKRKENGEAPLGRQDFFKVIYGVECYLVDDLQKIVTFGNTIEDPAFRDEKDNPIPAASYDITKGKYVVFDIETTGFSSDRDKIIEIGAAKYENGQKVDGFSEFINPGIPIPYRITQLTSITDDMVMQAPSVEEILPKFLEFCKGYIVVGHNVQFDIAFIKKNAKDLGLPCPLTTMDTMDMARVLLPGHKSYNLDAVGKLLNIVNPHHHRAIDDAETTGMIFERLLKMFQQGDHPITTLGEINAAADQNPDIIKRKRPYHCILLAQNTIGRVNLYRMVSESHLTYFYQKPKIPKSMLIEHREGIIVGSACVAGELMQALLDQKSEERIAEIVKFYDYLEIQPRDNNKFLIASERYEQINSMEDVLDLNRTVVKLGEQFHKPVVATCDVHFMDPEDQIYRAILQDTMHGDAEDPAPLFLRTTDEMMEEFSYLGSEKCEEVVITNTNKIADMVEALSPVRPDKCPPVIENSDEELRQICRTKAHRMYGETLPKLVEDRLERELNSIINNGYSVMYIIAQKLVWKSNEDGYLVGSRGSVGSSFAATMSGITEVNPLPPHYYCPECQFTDFDSDLVMEYVNGGQCGVDMPDRTCPHCGHKLMKDGFNIPFETFLGFKGDKEPDIDLNFSGEYQSKAHAYTKVIFGHEQTFKAGTIATVADKTAYGYVRGYCEHHGMVKRKCEMERLAAGMTGVRRSTGQHPGGIVVLPVGQEINTFTPVQHPANDMTTNIVTTHFDYHSIDHNLLKLDILGHDDPTIIRMLQDITGINPIELPLDDPGVMSLFKGTESLGITPEQNGGIKVGTLGVPEFGTKFVMGMLESTKPSTMSELIKISGLSHGTDVWLGNAEELIRQGRCTLATCIGCRDDIMVYLINKGVDPSESFKIMENVRKGKVAKGKVKEWPEWCADMKEHGVPDWYKEGCEKIKYMFPKGHAAAYVMMALRIAWFKVHEPLAYYCAYYSIRAKSFDYELMAQGQQHLLDMIADYTARKDSLTAAEQSQLDDMYMVREMYARGINFAPIELTKAKSRAFTIVDKEKKLIMASFNSLAGMGDKAADQLEEAVKLGPFVSRQDVRDRAKISSTIVDKMGELGILGELPESNQFSLFDLMM